MFTDHRGSTTEFTRELAAALAPSPARDALPDAATLHALVEAAFFASMYEEEARRLQFGIAWQPHGCDCEALVAIVPPVHVTPANLAKLAPAMSGEATSIAVRRDGDRLVAWALLEGSTAELPPLTIRVLAPGVLRVDDGGIARALYARGRILMLAGASVVESPSARLSRTFPAWTDGEGVDLRASIVTRLAARALAHGHGGMILIVPAELAEPTGVRVHYGVTDGANLLLQRYTRVIRDIEASDQLARLVASRPRGFDGRMAVRDEHQLAFAEAIEVVARLTAIDNALLLDTDLRIRGFGVQVIEAAAPDAEFQHIDPYSDDVHVDDLSTFKGTRHPAGVLFCLRQPREAAAIIASQDGNLSLAVKEPSGAVAVLGSYVRAFGWQ